MSSSTSTIVESTPVSFTGKLSYLSLNKKITLLTFYFTLGTFTSPFTSTSLPIPKLQPTTPLTLLINSINKSTKVRATKIDSIIKAIIRKEIKEDLERVKKENTTIIEYLNLLRINYYLERVKFANSSFYTKTTSKLLLFKLLFYLNVLLTDFLNLVHILS